MVRLTLALFGALLVACSAQMEEAVIFKCAQACPNGNSATLPDTCESWVMTADEVAKREAAMTGCNLSCQKTDQVCNDAK